MSTWDIDRFYLLAHLQVLEKNAYKNFLSLQFIDRVFNFKKDSVDSSAWDLGKFMGELIVRLS